MNKTTNRTDEAYREAIAKLDCYLRSGVAGFLAQAIDRLESVGVHCDNVPRNESGARLLLEHISR